MLGIMEKKMEATIVDWGSVRHLQVKGWSVRCLEAYHPYKPYKNSISLLLNPIIYRRNPINPKLRKKVCRVRSLAPGIGRFRGPQMQRLLDCEVHGL